MAVGRAEPEPRKVRARPQPARDGAPEAGRNVVVAPHLAVARAREQLGLERRVPVEACMS